MCGDNEGKGKCCPNSRMERFIQPSILLLLKESTAHGYALMSRLSGVGYREKADPGAVYRCLRALESDGYVISEWETHGSGPAKRLYKITSAGKAALDSWIETIRQNVDVLTGFINRYEQGGEKVDTKKIPCCDAAKEGKGECSPDQKAICHGEGEE